VTLGFGIFGENTKDTELLIPSPPAIPEMRLLSKEEQKRLFEPSERWQRERLRANLNFQN